MFYVLLLEQDIIKKEQMNRFLLMPEFEIGNNKEYEIEAIRDSAVYTKKANKYLLKLYYLII